MTNITRDEDFAAAQAWLGRSFPSGPGGAPELPFSFMVGNGDSAAVFRPAGVRWQAPAPAGGASTRTMTLDDPATGLECRCEMVEYADFPAVEWVLHLKNTGTADSDLLSNILPLDRIRSLMAEAGAMRRYFYGDFYPLLAFSLAPDAWAAWQFDLSDSGEGMVAAFRRHASTFSTWEARLRALDAEAIYELVSWDGHGVLQLSGRDLMDPGFTVTIEEQPGSALFTYRIIAASQRQGRP